MPTSNKNTVHCLFSAFTNVKKHNLFLNNALVDAEININQ